MSTLLFRVDINTLIRLHSRYHLEKISVCLLFVTRHTVFVGTVFFELLLILTVTGFSYWHSALR